LDGLRVLDAYAGSGALGLEALSRGAARVTFVESDPGVRAVLEENIRSLGVLDRCLVLGARIEDVLSGPGLDPVDLVLADPPYETDPVGALLAGLRASGALGQGARIVVERDTAAEPHEPGPGPISRIRSERYGRVRLDLYRYAAGPGPS
jgi:16S rRNA (guanine(966)-N(2))-methyltransferase RsmD